MAGEYGIKETLDVFRASQRLAVIVYKARDGGGDAAQIANRMAMAIMANPQAIADLKAAFDGIATVPKEVSDLSFGEVMELVAECGKLAADATKEIVAP